MATKTERAFVWVVLNLLFACLAIAGMYYNHEAVRNIFKFFFWALVVVYTCTALSKTCSKESRRKGLPVPMWVSHTYGILMITFLAALGHFWMASAWLWQVGCIETIYKERRNDEGKVN